jgi:hypothetical protein
VERSKEFLRQNHHRPLTRVTNPIIGHQDIRLGCVLFVTVAHYCIVYVAQRLGLNEMIIGQIKIKEQEQDLFTWN